MDVKNIYLLLSTAQARVLNWRNRCSPDPVLPTTVMFLDVVISLRNGLSESLRSAALREEIDRRRIEMFCTRYEHFASYAEAEELEDVAGMSRLIAELEMWLVEFSNRAEVPIRIGSESVAWTQERYAAPPAPAAYPDSHIDSQTRYPTVDLCPVRPYAPPGKKPSLSEQAKAAYVNRRRAEIMGSEIRTIGWSPKRR